MTETKVFLLTAVVVGLLFLYVYMQNRARPGGWMPEDARKQLYRERRVPPRIPCATEVSIAAGPRMITGTTVNVAIGGLLLKPSGALGVGEPVHITFELPKGPKIDIPGAVCRKQGEYVAVKFDFITEQRTLIQSWVDEQLGA